MASVEAAKPAGRMSGESATSASVDPADLRRAQELMLVLGRLGNTLTGALRTRVPDGLSDNVNVLVITSLAVNGPLRPSDVIALTGMSSGGVTKLLDRLEEHGLIMRELGRIKGDRRGTRLVLTRAGERVAVSLAEGIASEMNAIEEAVSDLRRCCGDQ